MSFAQPNVLKALLQRIRNKLFHPPYYRALRSPNSHLVFIERVDKAWGVTFYKDISYCSDMIADNIVKNKNEFLKSIYGDHDVYRL